jgi:hypothetical protein
MTEGIHGRVQETPTPGSDNRPSSPHTNHESSRSPSPVTPGDQHRGTLTTCNEIVNRYRRGEISKAIAYSTIQKAIFEADGVSTTDAEKGFDSFIRAIENHDAEVARASKRGVSGRKRRADTLESDHEDASEGDDNEIKKPKVDERDFPWVKEQSINRTTISPNLSRTLELLRLFSIDLKATKTSITNSPDCPEFPDTEWKNVIAGRAVNLDAVLSGQYSTFNNDVRTEKLGELEISFGAVEPTKSVKNGGDWNIAWNRAGRATAYAFPHRLDELSSYGDYITSLFGATNPSFYSRIVAFDKAVRRRVGSVRNIELWDYERFADLKIAHLDSIGVSIGPSGSRNDSNRSKNQRSRGEKKNEPCNNWNEDRCTQTKDECRRRHVCNVCGKSGHKGKECKQK